MSPDRIPYGSWWPGPDRHPKHWGRKKAKRTVITVDARGWIQDGIIAPAKRTSGTKARRQAVRWSTAEERDALAQVALGFDEREIAAWHERSVGGITSRLSKIYEDNDA
jgi:hypothetical protein